jgi:hypothetical protein
MLTAVRLGGRILYNISRQPAALEIACDSEKQSENVD